MWRALFGGGAWALRPPPRKKKALAREIQARFRRALLMPGRLSTVPSTRQVSSVGYGEAYIYTYTYMHNKSVTVVSKVNTMFTHPSLQHGRKRRWTCWQHHQHSVTPTARFVRRELPTVRGGVLGSSNSRGTACFATTNATHTRWKSVWCGMYSVVVCR